MIDTHKQDRTSTDQPLAAGTYLVGDPCYAFSNDLDENWQAWLADAWKDADANRVRILDGRVKGMRVVASGTAHGDGEYYDQDGYVYGVDAGLLGAVHIGFLANLHPRLANLTHGEIEAETGMNVVEFSEPFHVSYGEGTVKIGHVEIDTGGELFGNWAEDGDETDMDW